MTAKVNPLFEETSTPDELRPGTKLLHGQYEIKDYLNSGGFGITYLAKDSLDRQVVIKECFASAFCRRSDTIVAVKSRAHSVEFTALVRLFVQEAKNLAKLKHPNIVGVHQIFEDNDTAYMALDYVNGRDLLDLIEDPNDRVGASDVQAMTLKLLNAVGYIHSTGVLHRDISPDNILLERGTNNPVLIDFGAAREEAARQVHATSVMRVVKDGYSPQEFYIQGSDQTPSSDLYAFGATLFHLITGECPPDSQSRLAAIAAQKPDPFQGFSDEYKARGYSEAYLNAIVKAMQIFPYERIQTAKEWIDMIRPGPELVALPGGSRITPRRVVSQRLEEAQAQARLDAVAEKAAAIPSPATDTDAEIEVVRANRPERVERRERKQVDFLNIHTPPPPKQSSVAVPMMLGAVATCVVIGLGVIYFVPEARDVARARFDAASSKVQDLVGGYFGSSASTVEAPATAAPDTTSDAKPSVAPTDASAQPTLTFDTAPADATEIAAPEATAPAAPEASTPVAAPGEPAVVPAPEASSETPAVLPDAPAPRTDAAVTEPPLAGQAQAPLTAAPSLGTAPAEGETTPQVLASMAPVEDTPDVSAALSAASGVDAPTADRPVEAAGDVQDVSAVMSRWTVGLPFTGSGDGAEIGAVRFGAPAWMQPGTKILTVDGREVGSVAEISDAVRNSTWISGRTEVPVTVTYNAPGTSDVKTAQIDLPAVREVTLMNGTRFRSAFMDGSWQTTVVASEDAANPNGLRAGDKLIAYIPTSEKLSGPDAIAKIFERELAAGTTRFAFAVNRAGELWVASLAYAGAVK